MSEFVTGVSKVSTKFQATIPEDVRDRAGIEIGDEVKFVYDGRQVRVVLED